MISTKKNFSFANFRENIKNYVYSKFYLILLGLTTVLFWTAGWTYVGFSFLVVIACYLMLTQRDMTPIIPLIFSAMFIPRDVSPFSDIWIYLVFVPVVVCLIAHFIIYPVKKFRLGKLFFPFIGVLIAFVLGGITSNEIENYTVGLVNILGIGVAMPASYLILNQYICPDENVDFKKYISYAFIILLFAPCVEVLFIKFTKKFMIEDFIGWGNSGVIGYIVMTAIPLCFYLMVKTRKIVPYFIAVICFNAYVVVMGNDGCTGILAVFVPILTFVTCRYIEPEKRALFKWLFTTFIFLEVTAFLVFMHVDSNFFATIENRFINDTGRTKLYKNAVSRFLLYPLYGNGAYYAFVYEKFTNYHSLIFHSLATMGIIGLVAFLALIFSRFFVILKKNDSFNIFVFFSVFMFDFYSFIDCGEFAVFVMFINILTMLVEHTNELPNELPSTYSKLKYVSKKSNFI